ncbi:hypothetical protein Plec18167_008188 [Paecilomyces lecythidis]|uniref:Cytochrome P450 n=1 Tax=Paecilomyces lecythidis TaxID=3004212 RepID=A0ABR3WYN0_9EURO
MRWVLSQPDSSIGSYEFIRETNPTQYSLGDARYISDPWQGTLVKTQLNPMLDSLCDAINNELGVAFDEHFGTDPEWKEIDLYDAMTKIVIQVASRFTVGLPLCRDKEYLQANIDLIHSMTACIGQIGILPEFLKPILGPLLGWKTHQIARKIHRLFNATFRERQQYLDYDKDSKSFPEPNDHLQMIMRYAQQNHPSEVGDLQHIANRVIISNFGSSQQTNFVMTNMILDIVSSDAEFNTISQLREETSRVISTNGGHWNRHTIAQLVRADSVGRETLRLHAFFKRATPRKVLVDGVVTPDGINLPKGSRLAFLGYPAQIDEDVYEQPLKYDPFRFSRPREAATNERGNPGLNHLSFVSTSNSYLPFGHGKHACPGRFLIDCELKMLISYALMKYDLELPSEYNGKRPQNIWRAESMVPPPGVKLRVRWRGQE